jgi:hypothetical protein
MEDAGNWCETIEWPPDADVLTHCQNKKHRNTYSHTTSAESTVTSTHPGQQVCGGDLQPTAHTTGGGVLEIVYWEVPFQPRFQRHALRGAIRHVHWRTEIPSLNCRKNAFCTAGRDGKLGGLLGPEPRDEADRPLMHGHEAL